MNFILNKIFDFFSDWENLVTDCAMRLSELMIWRQCDRVFIVSFQHDRLCVSPLPPDAWLLQVFFFFFLSFSGVFLLFSCVWLRFRLLIKELMSLNNVDERKASIVCVCGCVNFNRQSTKVSVDFVCSLNNRWNDTWGRNQA